MKKIQISYPIFIGKGLIEKIGSLIALNRYSKSVIITGRNTPSAYVNKVHTSLPLVNTVFTVASGEQNKNLETIKNIWKRLHDFGCDKKSLVLNIGGGVITDLGGFAASTYLKGIDYVNIPTTLLCQVDAGIGGKTGINFNSAKNLIGSYQSPIGVINDISTLSTLSVRQLISGFGEVIKHGLIRDAQYFHLVSSKKPQDFTQNELINIVKGSCAIKAPIVEKDVRETSIGKILSFGHTIGSAVERSADTMKTSVLHGEAVIFGMIIETEISYLAGILSNKARNYITSSLKRLDLPIIDTISVHDIKKNAQFTLLRGIGRAVPYAHVDNDVISKALRMFDKKLHETYKGR